MEKLNTTTLLSIKSCKGIYKIKIHDKEYIGSSTNIGYRLKHHLWSLKNHKHHNLTMQNLYNKYGIDSIYFCIIEECNEDVLIEKETFYITTLKPYINHILNPSKIVRDDIYKKRLSESGKKSFENGRIIHNKKKTYMYDISGKFIKEFDDATKAAKEIGNSNYPTSICNVCNNKTHTAYGYRWSYKKVKKLSNINYKYKLQPVLQYSITNKFIKSWNSSKEASKTLNISNINRAIKKDLTAGGFKWYKAFGPH